MVRNRQRRGCFGEIHQDEIKGPKILLRQHGQTLCGVTKPPLHSFILEMGLGVKVLEALTNCFLIKFQSNDELDGGIFENFVQNHVVATAHECYAFQFFQVGSCEMNKWLVIVWTMIRTHLNMSIEIKTLIFLLGIFSVTQFLEHGTFAVFILVQVKWLYRNIIIGIKTIIMPCPIVSFLVQIEVVFVVNQIVENEFVYNRECRMVLLHNFPLILGYITSIFLIFFFETIKMLESFSQLIGRAL
mmetsp:Transcript_10834/g.19795  ORF Transcript_10834/g.19795 Transcript_10834/m.19795 type:complete len:244 (-) Transcript_10834:63-794(-)